MRQWRIDGARVGIGYLGTHRFGDLTQTTTYDRAGRVSSQTNERGYGRAYHYDAQGNLAKEWDGVALASGLTQGLEITRAFDSFGRRTAEHQKDLATGEVRSQSFAYDGFDQLTQHIDALGNKTTRTYDLSGNIASETNANGWALLESDAPWAREARQRLGIDKAAADLTAAERATILAAYTEHLVYDGENRLIQRTDRLGKVWSTLYDAYGNVVQEQEPNGRVTSYTLGAFGQVLHKHVRMTDDVASTADKPNLEGRSAYTESYAYDWMGQLAHVSDSYGKDIAYAYNAREQLVAIDDVGTGLQATYTYDLYGQRTAETLVRDGQLVREQSYAYTDRGWLTDVIAEDYQGEATQTVRTTYQYDAVGNRARVGEGYNGSYNAYAYDAGNRMQSVVEHARQSNGSFTTQTLHSLGWNAYDDRVIDNQGSVTYQYQYDAGGRLIEAWKGEVKPTDAADRESWRYDAVGNVVYHHFDKNLSLTTYDRADRTAVTTSWTDVQADGDLLKGNGNATTTTMRYDGAGQVKQTRIDHPDYGFTEVDRVDVRGDSQRKRVENSWAKGASGLRGESSFTYDVNGQLVFLDRGRAQGARQNTVATFAYDADGHIIRRTEGPDVARGAMETFLRDPLMSTDPEDWSGWSTPIDDLYARWFGDRNLQRAQLNTTNHYYANGQRAADAQYTTERQARIVRLSVLDMDPESTPPYNAYVYEEDGDDYRLISHRLVIRQDDLAGTNGDREAIARNIAQNHFTGFAQLGELAQQAVVNYILERLPETPALNNQVHLNGYIVVLDETTTAPDITRDYSLMQLGGKDGLKPGAVMRHTVADGDSLRAMAAMYYGSPSYWYVIAEANGLQSDADLKVGQSLTIPASPTNSLNDKDTFKLYSEAEIIGSTSPETQTIPKKKKWYQKLVQVLIIVIVIAVAVVASMFVGPAIMGALGPVLGTLAAGAAGYAMGYAASMVTQHMAVWAGLQEEVSSKAARNMGKSVGIGAITGGWLDGISQAETVGTIGKTAARVAVEMSRQYAQDGRIGNVSGILMSMAGSALPETHWINQKSTLVGAGLSVLEAEVRGTAGTLDWTHFAAAAVGGMLGGQEGDLKYHSNQTGAFDWSAFGREVLQGAAVGGIVAARHGLDAGLQVFGQMVGQTVGSALGERLKFGEAIGGLRAAHEASNARADAEFDLIDLTERGDLTVDQYAGLIGDDAKMRQFMELRQRASDTYGVSRIAQGLAEGADPQMLLSELYVRAGMSDVAMGATTEAQERLAELRRGQEALQIATNVYQDTGAPEGYIRVNDDPELLAKLGLDGVSWQHEESGFFAALYMNEADGSYMLAFRGTDEFFKDFTQANIPQALGRASEQYELADRLAVAVHGAIGKTGSGLTITGHSLGGGLAAASAMAIDTPAITFNAAGVHSATADMQGSDSLITHYYIRGEIVDRVQRATAGLVGPPAQGRQVELTPVSSSGQALRLEPGSTTARGLNILALVLNPVVGAAFYGLDLLRSGLQHKTGSLARSFDFEIGRQQELIQGSAL